MIDFLVIGGGIAGLSVAARLSEHGSVTVLEREPVCGYHASGRSAAMFEETYGAPSTRALNRASKHWHLHENGAINTPRGLLLLGSAGTEDAFAHDATSMNMQEVSVDEARGMMPILNPDHVTQAAFHAEAYDIDTDATLARFTKMLRSNGGTIVTDAPVTKVQRTAKGWDVLAGQNYAARQVVNAAGAWADQVAELACIQTIGLQPMRRSMARVAAPDDHDVSSWPMLFGPGETWYAKPDAGALLISPADQDPCAPQDAWADDMVLAEGIARYQPHVTAQVKRMLSNWAGLRSFAPDRQLVLGSAPQDSSFIWCAAQGGYGMQTAPAASRLTADLALGIQPELDAATIAQLSPGRFA